MAAAAQLAGLDYAFQRLQPLFRLASLPLACRDKVCALLCPLPSAHLTTQLHLELAAPCPGRPRSAAAAASCSGAINRDANSPCGLNFSPTCSFLELGKCATGGGKSQLPQGQQSGGHGDPEKSQCVECERDRSDEFKMMQECDSATAVAMLRAVMTRRPPCRRYLTTVVKLPKQNFTAASACQIKELDSAGLLAQLCPAGTEAVPSRSESAPPVTVDGPCNLNPAGRLLARRHSVTI